jgi:hypothetical protein
MDKKLLNDIPTVIDGPGLYECRNGKFATIHEIKQPPPESGYVPNTGMTTFPAKGSIWTKRIGQPNPPFETWHVSGRVRPDKESRWDIVRKVQGD